MMLTAGASTFDLCRQFGHSSFQSSVKYTHYVAEKRGTAPQP